MSERDMRTKVVKALRSLHAVPVENPVFPGTPDVNCIGGWIELKWLRSWPANPSTRVVVPRFRRSERRWLMRRRQAGGQCYLLLQVKREWILIDGAIAAIHLNSLTREELIAKADYHTRSGLNAKELTKWVSRTPNAFLLTDADAGKLKKMLHAG